MNKIKNIILLVVAFSLGLLVMYIGIKSTNRTQIYEKTSINKAINKIYDATVLVEAVNGNAVKNTGTGFFYKKDNKYGYIITNEHVLSNYDVEIVTSKDERVKAEVLGKDEYLDLAVLRVDKKYVRQIATIGNSDKSLLGDTVFIVGSPLGYDYRGSVSQGILSGKDRLIQVETTNEEESLMKVIQVDASINPGNSGGPLLNINGEVIGIVSLKLVDDDIEGMGFAIPIEYAMNYVEPLEKNEKIKFPELGIKITDYNDTSTLLQNNIDINQEYGVVVLENKNNLKKGDLIVKVNNHQIKDIPTLNSELYQFKSKDKVKLTIIRNNIKRNIIITLS